MKKNNLLVVGLLVLLAAVVGGLYLIGAQKPSSAKIAQIKVSGKVIKEINLDTVEEPYTFEVEEAGHNQVAVEKGRISIKTADCPDQICVRQGWIADGVAPIVCLPNQLTIEITGTESEQAYDILAK